MGSYGVYVDVQPGKVAQPLWLALCAASKPLSVRQLHRRTHAHPESIATRLRLWRRVGLLQITGTRVNKFAIAEEHRSEDTPPPITKAGVIGLRRPITRSRIWKAMRVLKSFDLPTLIMTVDAPEATIRHYISELSMAGFIRNASPRIGVPATYILMRRSGPLYPRRVGPALLDPNNGRTYPLARARSRQQQQQG